MEEEDSRKIQFIMSHILLTASNNIAGCILENETKLDNFLESLLYFNDYTL